MLSVAMGNNGMTSMHIASSIGSCELVEALHERNADVDAPHKFAGSTPLHFAAEMNETETVRTLCRLHANAAREKAQGGRPLHVAADLGFDAVATVLLEQCGSDPG